MLGRFLWTWKWHLLIFGVVGFAIFFLVIAITGNSRSLAYKDCNNKDFREEIVELIQRKAPDAIKIYPGATEVREEGRDIACRGVVATGEEGNRYVTYYTWEDADGDRFLGYRMEGKAPPGAPVLNEPTPTPTTSPTNRRVVTTERAKANDAPTTAMSNKTMNAHVNVLPGGVQIFNNDPFPWYGLIVTIDDHYSSKYYFDSDGYNPPSDPEAIVEPGELDAYTLDFLVDKDGNEFEGKLYTITISKVKLEAKTQVDGPYDLYFEITTEEANAIPIPDPGPDLRIWPHPTMGLDSLWIKPHHEHYAEIRKFLEDYPPPVLGGYTLPQDAYLELKKRFNLKSF